MKKSSLFVRGMLVIVSLGIVACQKDTGDEGAATKPVEWKFAIEEIQGSVQDSYARRFAKAIEEETNGEIKVEVYPYGSLGSSDQLTELVRSGALQFAMASPGHLGKLVPETQALLLHFVLSDDDAVNREVLHGDAVLGHFRSLYEAKGLSLLDFLIEGWQAWTTKTPPIREPAAFGGLKIRVMTSPVLVAAYEAYGANPTPMAYSEVYSALQLEMIDGQVNPVFAIQEMSFYEVTDSMTLARQAPFVASVVTNPKFLQGLSAERRAIVERVVRDLRDPLFEVQREFNEKRLEKIREARPDYPIVELDDAEREAFREASLPVRDRFVEITGPSGKKTLDLLVAEVAEAESGA